jgi:hypothetical protein
LPRKSPELIAVIELRLTVLLGQSYNDRNGGDVSTDIAGQQGVPLIGLSGLGSSW